MPRASVLCLAVALFLATQCPGGEPAAPGVVSNIKVISDKVEDVSSVEALQAAILKEGMTDEQKALALWNTVVKFRHHDLMPREYLGLSDEICHDAIKLFNVYGYCAGPGAQSSLLALCRSANLPARGWSINRWGVPEVFFDNAWHCLDAGMISYFVKPDGKIASVEELVAGVKGWHEKNPGYLGEDKKIKQFLAESGVKNGPEILKNCPTLDARGNYTLNYFGWYSAMIIFDGSNKTPFLFEESYTQGHRMNIQLRKGEKLTRNWDHKGLDLCVADGRAPECLKLKVGSGALYYTPKLGDLANGRIGKGTLEYDVPLATDFRAAAIVADNLASKSEDQAEGAVHVKDPAKEAVLILRRPCSYVYLTGELTFDAKVGEGGEIAVAFSDNHGLDWKELARLTASEKKIIDLKANVLRRYDYRLKFTLKGKGTGLDSLKIANDIQLSQRALPALDKGANTISFNAGAQEGTVTVEPAGLKAKGKQPTFEDYRVQLNNFSKETLQQWNTIAPAGGNCEVTIPIETPGDLVRLRFGCDYRARDKAEGWDLQVSFDDGKTFKTVDRAAGPCSQNAKFIAYSDVPPGVRKAQVRFSGTQRTTLVIFGCRVDADYKEPLGGFAPVKVTYTWEENGQPKQDTHVSRTAQETYTINCEQKPVMKSIVLELAP